MIVPTLVPELSTFDAQKAAYEHWYNTPAISAPPGITSNLVNPHSISYKTTICDSVCAVVIVNCVILRMISRASIVKKVSSDDYIILIALAFWIATTAMFQYLVSVGMGKHLWDVRTTDYSPFFLRGWAIAAILYSSCMMFIKVSILMLYRRIFPIGTFMPSFRWWFVMCLTVGYSLGGICSSLFACIPVESAWNIWIKPDHCIDTASFYIANGVLNCISDLLILALPLPIIWRLSLARRQKIHLSMMFGVGFVSCIISIVRLQSIIVFLNHGISDITYDIVAINMWSQIEFTAAFICACSPALRPFLIWLFGSFFREHSSASDPSRGPYMKTSRFRSRVSRDMFNIELGAPSKTRTTVSATRTECDNESARGVSRKASTRTRDRDRDCDKISESGEEFGIVVETTYRVQSGLPSPLPQLE